MNMIKRLIICGVIFFLAYSCNNDDEGTVLIPPRDYAEVVLEDHAAIEEYLQTHFYYVNNVNPPSGFSSFIELFYLTVANLTSPSS